VRHRAARLVGYDRIGPPKDHGIQAERPQTMRPFAPSYSEPLAKKCSGFISGSSNAAAGSPEVQQWSSEFTELTFNPFAWTYSGGTYDHQAAGLQSLCRSAGLQSQKPSVSKLASVRLWETTTEHACGSAAQCSAGVLRGVGNTSMPGNAFPARRSTQAPASLRSFRFGPSRYLSRVALASGCPIGSLSASL
jgi:hypothetical protein